jgi:hypothetical protein
MTLTMAWDDGMPYLPLMYHQMSTS